MCVSAFSLRADLQYRRTASHTWASCELASRCYKVALPIAVTLTAGKVCFCFQQHLKLESGLEHIFPYQNCKSTSAWGSFLVCYVTGQNPISERFRLKPEYRWVTRAMGLTSAWESFLVCHMLYIKNPFQKGSIWNSDSETWTSMGHKSNEVGEGGEGEKSIPLMPLKVDLIQEYIILPPSFKIVEQLIYNSTNFESNSRLSIVDSICTWLQCRLQRRRKTIPVF